MSSGAEQTSPAVDGVDLLVVAVETNLHHGVGILLKRLFPDSSSFVTLRSRTSYNGQEAFGSRNLALGSSHLARSALRDHLAGLLGPLAIRRVLCVPYYPSEFRVASILKEMTGAPLCTFLMDDQNVVSPHVSDRNVAELLAVSDLRLGISEEMCVAYEAKFGLSFHWMPPLLESHRELVPCYWEQESGEPLRFGMIGNVWSARRFDQLRTLLRETGVHADWYGNGPFAHWLDGRTEEWERDNIRCVGFLPEEDLVAALASYPFVLVPSGSGGPDDDNPAFSRLSLPSRLIFLHGRTDTPVLVLGSPASAAGHFVVQHGTGLCASTDPSAFRDALAGMTEPGRRRQLRANIRRIAPATVLERGGDWIWRSLEAGTPIEAPFIATLGTLTDERRRLIHDWVAPVEAVGAIAAGGPLHALLGCAYSRRDLLPGLVDAGLIARMPEEEVEITEFARAAAVWHVMRLAPEESDVLCVGKDPPPVWVRACPKVRLWSVANFDEWIKAPGGSVEPAVRPLDASDSPVPSAFSVVWSCGSIDVAPQQKPDMMRFPEFCRRMTAPGGCNVHLLSAVLHPAYFWVHPLYHELRVLAPSGWPDIDDILTDDGAFFMSAEAYERHWQPHTKKSAADFGRLLWMGVAWRAPL